jgi:hypothetical protein
MIPTGFQNAIEIVTVVGNGLDPATKHIPLQEEVQKRDPKTPRQVLFNQLNFSSNNRKFTVLLPSSHAVIHTTQISIMEKKGAIVDRIAEQVANKQYVSRNWHETSKRCIQMVMAEVQAFALSVLGFALPVLSYARLLFGTGMESFVCIDRFAKYFPSKDTSRDWVLENAVDCLIEMGEKIKGKRVCLACDKGNKRGCKSFCKDSVMVGQGSHAYILRFLILMGVTAGRVRNSHCTLSTKALMGS